MRFANILTDCDRSRQKTRSLCVGRCISGFKPQVRGQREPPRGGGEGKEKKGKALGLGRGGVEGRKGKQGENLEGRLTCIS